MAMLRESPWYSEIEKEGLERGLRQGLEQGLEQGQAEMLLRVLDRRFGPLPAELVTRIYALRSQQLTKVLDVVLDAATLREVSTAVEALSTGANNGNPPSAPME